MVVLPHGTLRHHSDVASFIKPPLASQGRFCSLHICDRRMYVLIV